ncbi:MAG: galactose mutarotase [Rhodobacterales bacterium CG2_30_65_12]|nr:MAG: galactose mutarotase [Rhodobacterales bacterium CG2_30_65_12]
MSRFGEMPDGTPVERVTIRGGGLTAHVLSYGAVLQDLRFKGHDAPLVLGFPDFAPYLTHSPYFGATAGRCANRIHDGHVVIDGKTFQLDRNFLGKHMLHGGAAGMGKRVWQIDTRAEDRIGLTLTQEDGDMGFPGRLKARVRVALLPGGVLDIRMEAETDAPTLCNLAHHSYFTLGGETISDHLLQIQAETYLPVDDELIPTGEERPVAGTRFDFRTPAPVRQAQPVDHNFCLARARGTLRPVAWLKNPATGLTMELHTTEPGLQVYDGARIGVDLPGLSGQPMRAHAGLALEPQVWPDANHHAAFPQALLRPGETYSQHTQYIFSKDTP